MTHIISGIQQVGIGVLNVHEAFRWYNLHFGMDVPVFDEAAEARGMFAYTGGKTQHRRAILAINMKGGGGFEIWQYTNRIPRAPEFRPEAGDIGVFCTKIKTDNINAAFAFLKEKKVHVHGEVSKNPQGIKHFYVDDPYGNLFEIVEECAQFSKGVKHTGGVAGVVIGVTDMDSSIDFYSSVLGYDKVLYRGTGHFGDMASLPGGAARLERVLLTHEQQRKGPLSDFLGDSKIELVRVTDRQPRKIFENRYWGDLGFIHLCFDIRNMKELKKNCEEKGHPFTVDGGEGFEMGDASGHFCYIEDPDGTLIEFVETRKVPVMKKLNWYLDLRGRSNVKPLPRWMLRALRFGRKKIA